MSTTNFDTLTNVANDLNGQINTVDVFDGDMDPNHVLSRNAVWSVKVNWQISGLCAPGIGGDWKVRVNLESMGAGFEGTLKEQTVPVSNIAPAATRVYETTVNLQRPSDVSGFIAGAYKLIVIITHTNTGGGLTKRTRMAGFFESYMLEFIDADV